MILEIKEAKKADNLNGLEDVIVNAQVIVKEFDDSVYLEQCIENKVRPERSKVAFKTTLNVSLPLPDPQSFTPLSEVSKNNVLSWIKSSEKLMTQISKFYDAGLWRWNRQSNSSNISTVEFN